MRCPHGNEIRPAPREIDEHEFCKYRRLIMSWRANQIFNGGEEAEPLRKVPKALFTDLARWMASS